MYDLTGFGLTTNQSRVYQAGLQIGSRSVSTYATFVGFKRVLTYNILQELCSLGLASCVVIGKTGYYTMQHPKVWQQKLSEKAESFQTLVPGLESLLFTSTSGFNVQAFQGLDGMKTLYSHLLDSKTDLKAFLGADHIEPNFREYLYSVYLPKRVERGIKNKTIVSQTEENMRFADKKQVPLTEVRVLANPIFDPANEILLFDGDKIVIASMSSNEMSGLLIESKNTFTTLEQLFDILWLSLEQTTSHTV